MTCVEVYAASYANVDNDAFAAVLLIMLNICNSDSEFLIEFEFDPAFESLSSCESQFEDGSHLNYFVSFTLNSY